MHIIITEARDSDVHQHGVMWQTTGRQPCGFEAACENVFGITSWRSLQIRLNSVAKPTEFVTKPFLDCVTFFATGSCRHSGEYKKHRRAVNTSSNFYWDTCGFFSSATKWKNCTIVPRGHWALNTMTTNCDPMWSNEGEDVHMLLSVALYFNVFGLRWPEALQRKRSKYLQTHTQVVLFAANPH